MRQNDVPTDDHETVLRQITDGEIMVATGATRLHISIADMLALLSQRGIDPPYSVEDLHVDLGLSLSTTALAVPLLATSASKSRDS